MSKASIVQYILVIFSLVVLIAAITMGYLGQRISSASYNTTGGITRKYYQQSTPVTASFIIAWGAIYIWNLANSIYLTVALFLPDHKSPLKQDPPLLSNYFFIAHTIAFACTLVWVLVFDRELLEVSLVVIIVCLVSVYVAISLSCKQLADGIESGRVDETTSKNMIWCVRILTQNGLGVFRHLDHHCYFAQYGDCYNLQE
uniref:Uncharacterized protein n=1 Tax=Ciona savignyi TaxID=51511 RepID=H2YLN0_CIOSA